MSSWRKLVRAFTREADEHAARARDVAASLKTMRGDVRSIRREVAAVAARADAVSRVVAQLRRLHEGGRDLPAVLDGLAAVLDADRMRAHVRAAMERAQPAGSPVRRLDISSFWPDDVYEVLTAAIPDPVFFDGAAGERQTLRMPPRLAPAAAIATWTLATAVVEDVVVPVAAARLRAADRTTGHGSIDRSALDIAPGRLVRQPAWSSETGPAPKPWHWGCVVIDLTTRQEAPERGNTAVALVTPAEDDLPPPPAPTVRHTFEVWFGSKPA